jgi:hypothetical protein
MRILICRLSLEISKIKVAHQIAQKYIRISNGSWTGWFRNLRLYSPSAIWIHNPVRSRIINSHGITAHHLRDRENCLRNPASGRNNQGYHSEKPLSLHRYPCMLSCRGTYVMKRAKRYIKVLRRRGGSSGRGRSATRGVMIAFFPGYRHHYQKITGPFDEK